MIDPKLSNTSKVGYQPNIQQPVRPVSIDLGDLRPPTNIGQLAADDRAKIDDFLNNYLDVRGKLEDFDSRLDNILENAFKDAPLGTAPDQESNVLSYDPDTYPDLWEAHHHICGRPGATNVITYADIQNRWAVEKAQVAATVGLPTNLDDLDNMNGKNVQASISKSIAKAIAQMLDAVWRQILIWVLQFHYNIVKPLESVPIVKAVPKLIKSAINKLNNSPNAGQNSADSLLGTPTVDISGNVTADDLARAGGGYIASVTEVIQNLPPQCLIHTANWNRIVESIIRDGPMASPYYAKKVNSAMLDRMDALNKMAAVGIPNGHVFTARGTTLTYTNPLPEEYLQARADGSTKFGAISDGLISSVKEVGSTFVPRMDGVIRNILADPNLLCCLLRNLSFMANTQKLRKILLYIQALLQFWRNLHVLDLSKEIARLGNMIMDLINKVLQSIFSLYISYFNSKLSAFAVKIADLDKFTHLSIQCKPWNELINLAMDILKEMLQKITSYLSGFFLQFRLDLSRSNTSCEEIQKLSNVDKLLDLINKILQFSAAWAACVENNQDPRVVLPTAGRLSNTKNGIVLAPQGATKSAASLGVTSSTSGQGSGSSNTSSTRSIPTDGPFSSDGLQVLLTNYLGMTNDKARQVINSIDDCACDKSLTPEELADIERFIEEKT